MELLVGEREDPESLIDPTHDRRSPRDPEHIPSLPDRTRGGWGSDPLHKSGLNVVDPDLRRRVLLVSRRRFLSLLRRPPSPSPPQLKFGVTEVAKSP